MSKISGKEICTLHRRTDSRSRVRHLLMVKLRLIHARPGKVKGNIGDTDGDAPRRKNPCGQSLLDGVVHCIVTLSYVM